MGDSSPSSFSDLLRQQGNELFKAHAFEDAIEKYTAALNTLESSSNNGPALKNQKAVLLSNRAACHIALERWPEAVSDCQSSLSVDPSFSKTYLRLGKALERVDDPAGALRSYTAAIHYSLPENGGTQGRVDSNVYSQVEQLQRTIFSKSERSARWRKLKLSGKPPQLIKSSAVQWRGSVYLFGGLNPTPGFVRQSSNRLSVLDTHTLTWSQPGTLGTTPAPRYDHRSFVYRDSMYICGGTHSPTFDIWRLNLTTMRWTAVPGSGDAPPGLAQFSLCLDGETVLVWGGRVVGEKNLSEQRRHSENLFSFHLRTAEWRRNVWSGSYLPRAVLDRGTCPLGDGGSLLAFFGSSREIVREGGGATELSHGTVDRLSVEEQRWESVPMLGVEVPSSRSQVAVVNIPEHEASIILGGFYEGSHGMGGVYFNECWMFHHGLGVWTRLKNSGDRVPAGAQPWMVLRSDSKIFMGGGFRTGTNSSLESLTDVYELTIPNLDSLATSAGSSQQAMKESVTWKDWLPSHTLPTSVSSSFEAPVTGAPHSGELVPRMSPERTLPRRVTPIPAPAPAEAAAAAAGKAAAGKVVAVGKQKGSSGSSSSRLDGKKRTGGSSRGGQWRGDIVQGTDMVRPSGPIHWQLEVEPPWELRNLELNPMLAKLQYTSRLSMGVKTVQEARAQGQPQRLRARNVAAGRQLAHSLELHIRLRHIQPPIWRRIQVPGNLTLSKLFDQVLCPVIGWSRNLHAYKMRPVQAEPGESWYGPILSKAPDMMTVKLSGEGLADDTKVMIGDLLFQVGDSLAFIYDLRKQWDHCITVTQTLDPAPGQPFASVQVLDGWGACPPENSDDLVTYIRQLSIMADPQHLEHKSILAHFLEAPNKVTSFVDPCEFDIGIATSAVEAAMCPSAPKMKAGKGTNGQPVPSRAINGGPVQPVGQVPGSNGWVIVPTAGKKPKSPPEEDSRLAVNESYDYGANDDYPSRYSDVRGSGDDSYYLGNPLFVDPAHERSYVEQRSVGQEYGGNDYKASGGSVSRTKVLF